MHQPARNPSFSAAIGWPERLPPLPIAGTLRLVAALFRSLHLRYLLTITLLVVLNIATLASVTLYNWAHGLLAGTTFQPQLPDGIGAVAARLRQENQRLTLENNQLKKSVQTTTTQLTQLQGENRTLKSTLTRYQANAAQSRQIVTRIASRTAASVTRNVGTLALEATPYIGIGAVFATTAYDLNDACTTLREASEAASLLEEGATIDSDKVCGIKLPTREELTDTVINGITTTTTNIKESVKTGYQRFYDALGGTLYKMTQ
jgi:hypothetical protein